MLLRNPVALQTEYERRLRSDEKVGQDHQQLDKQIRSVQPGISRLIDAYEMGLLEKRGFEPRIRKAKERLTRLQAEAAEIAQQAIQEQELRVVIGHLQDFAVRVQQDWNRLTGRPVARSFGRWSKP